MFALKENLNDRAEELFQKQQEEIYVHTDQLFAKLMFWQWLATILLALVISPQTWSGQSSAIHIHVWASIFLGGAISLFPIWMTRAWPGAAITRYVIAVAQMLMSALLISVTGGRIETHFHVFGSLVILSFYRDWRVLIPATIVVGLDHFIRGVYWPYSVYGVLTASPWRSIEHAAWVVFEDVFLAISCFRSIREMRSIANRTAALEASEQKFREIFEEAPIGMAVVGLDEKFRETNPALSKMLGYSEEELRAISPIDITHPEDVATSRELAQAMLDDTVHNTVEKRYIRRNREVVWTTRTGGVIRDDAGNPRQFLIMVEDITERKRAEEALHESKRELEAAVQANQLIMDNSLDVICSVDEEGRFLNVNAACEQLWGYKPDELIGRQYIDLVHPDDHAKTKQARAALRSSGTIGNFVNRYIRKDGSLVDVLWSASWSETDKITFAVAHDITERKKAEEALLRAKEEEALRKAEQKYRAIFENAIEGIFQTTPAGKYISVNPAMARMYGYDSPEELMGNVADIGQTVYVDPERRNEFKRLIESQGSVELFEYEVYRKDGSKIWLSENARAVRDEDGTVIYYEGTVEDITEQKRVKEVERASKAKSEFLSRMSHELRTPLNAILGFGQLLERQRPTAVQKTRISHILNAGRHLLNLINEILDIARVESGRFQLSLEPVVIDHAVDEAIDLIRPLAAERKIEITRTPLRESSPSVLADRQRLKQVLLNLLSNAVKYNREAGRVIVDLVPQPQERFRISVIDEGPGIPADKRKRLFSPFDRLGAEDSETQGTGLGLALSKRLTEAMGGTIGEGGPAMGACFWIEFPIVKGVQEQLDSSRTAATSLTKLNGDEKTLLYIEDNLSNLSLVEHLLGECAPLKLISAMQGQLGIELAARHQPDLILLDVHLPDINGADVLARLKAKARTRDIPVVVLSADATKSQIDRLMSLGATDYLTKPLDVECFLKVIEQHFCEPASTNENGA